MDGEAIDPTQATSPDLNRRAFVGFATALGAGAVAAPALAQTAAPLGQPHPPLVPEDDPTITVDCVHLDRSGVSMPAYAAWPKNAGPATGSVVVIMHVWGVDTSIRDVVRRLAKAGFAAIAPDLYARTDAPSGDGASDIAAFRPYAKQLDRTLYDGDAATAAEWLKSKFPGTKTGIIGFCMGGRIAMLAAIDNGARFAAVCPFYGPVEGVDPTAIRMPFCGSYGARDTGIPAASVRAFAAALTVPHDLRIYDEAGHAFLDDERSAYVASAAADAWARTIAFLKKYTAGP
ncbi:MAG TPA: dienelactone hydrolase family protein [Candidatus Tumulicola sp.]|jgi:carboxymethylenebutenolidase